MEQLNLDFSQPTNRLTVIADIERKKNIVKNDYSEVGNRYGRKSIKEARTAQVVKKHVDRITKRLQSKK